jgi:hypothetical protein
MQSCIIAAEETNNRSYAFKLQGAVGNAKSGVLLCVVERKYEVHNCTRRSLSPCRVEGFLQASCIMLHPNPTLIMYEPVLKHVGSSSSRILCHALGDLHDQSGWMKPMRYRD